MKERKNKVFKAFLPLLLLLMSCQPSPSELLISGNEKVQKGDYDGAIEDYSNLIKLDSTIFQGYHNRGVCFYDKGDYNNALLDLKKAVKLNDSSTNAKFHLGITYSKTGNFTDAIDVFKSILPLNKTNTRIPYELGLCYFKIGKFPDALPYLKESFIIHPDSVNLALAIGITEYQLGKYESAVTNLKVYCSAFPDSEICIRYLAKGQYYLEDYENSISNFTIITSLNPSLDPESKKLFIDAYVQIGHQYGALADYAKAIEYYTGAITIDPLTKDAYLYRGLINLSNGWTEEACLDLTQAMKNGHPKANEIMQTSCGEFVY